MTHRYMLDTNTVSHILRHRPETMQHVQQHPVDALCISCITYAELRYGLEKKPETRKLPRLLTEFLKRVETMPFTSECAETYAKLRVVGERAGKSLSSMDMLIAAHAHHLKMTLVTSGAAFSRIPNLVVESWSR